MLSFFCCYSLLNIARHKPILTINLHTTHTHYSRSTGKQIISLLVQPNSSVHSPVNVESQEKFYTSDRHMCHMDGFVAFCNGEHVCGNLGKKTLGGESKHGLFYVLIRDYGPKEATRCMSRLAKLCARFLGNRGFSIGVNDVTPSIDLQKRFVYSLYRYCLRSFNISICKIKKFV